MMYEISACSPYPWGNTTTIRCSIPAKVLTFYTVLMLYYNIEMFMSNYLNKYSITKQIFFCFPLKMFLGWVQHWLSSNLLEILALTLVLIDAISILIFVLHYSPLHLTLQCYSQLVIYMSYFSLSKTWFIG